MTTEELEIHVSTTLRQLLVKYKKGNLLRGLCVQLLIPDFGLSICCLNRNDYGQTRAIMTDQFAGWRVLYITPSDDLIVTKYKIIWALMRGGYMKWLRYSFPRQVRHVLTGQDNLAHRIIEERLKIWANRPKYKFLIEDNKAALKGNINRELSTDPSFFDYMPEEESDV